MHRLSIFSVFVAVASAWAAPVTPERIASLPAAEQAAWQMYWQRSLTNAALDAAALQVEVAAEKLPAARRAPSGGDFKLSYKLGDAWFASDAARTLADIVISYQTPAGGWSKHNGYTKGPRPRGTQWSSQYEPGRSPHYLATFDNRATTEELRFLAGVGQATQREDCRAAFLRGLEFILAAQYPNGGWPQVYPLEGDYHDDVTFNDNAMTRVLELLSAVNRRESAYAFVDEPTRQRVVKAMAAGIQCVLQTQVRQDGQLTAWCAQYDALTLQPSAARKMEPVALSGLESADVVGCLMSVNNPAPEVVAAIEAALGWLERVKLTGLAPTKVDGKTAYVANPASTKVYWARFYHLTNNQPMFPGRDGVIYNSFAELAAQNRLGYDYLTTLPGSIVNNGQKKWRKQLAGDAKKSAKSAP